MTKSLPSKLHLKQGLYSNHMTKSTSLEDHLTTFKEIVSDIETMEVKYDEDLDEVHDGLFSKEKMKHLVIRSEAQAEGLIGKGRTHKKNFGGVVGDKTCNYYKKKGHIIS